MKNARPLAGKVAIIASLTISVFLSLSVSSNASGILYQFNAPVSNSANHGASIPALTADFQNANHGVFLTISGSGLTANEFASDIYFNLNPALDAASLVFSPTASTGTFAAPTIQQSPSQSFNANGNGKYNLEFNFGTADGKKFTSGDSITYLISGITGLNAADFAFLCLPAGKTGSCYTEAHIDCHGNCGGTWIYGSTPTPVPEPAPVALFFLAFFLFVAKMRRVRGFWGSSPAMAAQKRKTAVFEENRRI